jgi:tRNA threonylcarbamoyladenosine biosynthesis protein TsaE
MVYKKFVSKSAEETYRFGFNWAKKIKKGEILALFGNLGTGKTTFVKGLAAGLKVKETVLSPSFVIVNRYRIGRRGKGNYLYHVDLYRLRGRSQLIEAGIGEILEDKDGVIVIEWAGGWEEILPVGTIKIKFKYLGENKREIIFKDESFKKKRA